MADQTQNKNQQEKSFDVGAKSETAAQAEVAKGPELQPLGSEQQEAAKPVQAEAAEAKEGEKETGAPATEEEKPATPQTEQGIPSLQQPPQAVANPIPKSKVRKRIEAAMAEDLTELYQHMDPPTKAAFKAQAKVVASRIEEMIATATVRARDILELIRGWLCMIPGINKFFLEQETKIKADKIADIAMNKHKYQ